MPWSGSYHKLQIAAQTLRDTDRTLNLASGAMSESVN